MGESSLALSLTFFGFMLTIIWGQPLIRILRHFKVGDTTRLEVPQQYIAKKGTPTMGGVLFIIPTVIITILLNAASLIGLTVLGRSIFLPLGTMILFGGLGTFDDWQKLRGRRGEGIPARIKIIIQVVLSVIITIGLRYVLDAPELYIPVVGREIELGFLYIPIAAFIIVAAANAVNFTDGMDGLAGLISATAFATIGMIALIQGQIYLGRFCYTLVGALFGFLWFNVHPAELIMGDTGSGAIGATLGVVALMTGYWILLPLIAIIPVSEAMSVILQVGYFKLSRGKRIFKMAPLHYHFELSGWSEVQVVQRFWLISLLSAMLGVALTIA